MSELFRDRDRPVAERVGDLLGRMTLDEKVAQLCSVWLNETDDDGRRFAAGADALDLPALIPDGIGGLTRPFGSGSASLDRTAEVVGDIQRWLVEETRLGIPALVHEECLTGLMVPGATVMPSPLNWGAAFDPELVADIGAAIRAQMDAVGAHQGLAPVLDVVRDQRYGRVEECIAEDAYLVGVLGAAYIAGLQGPDGLVIATAKHFAGHAAPESGHNTAPVHVGPRELADVHLLPFELAVDAGVAAIMSAYHDVDGVPATASRELLQDVLRDRWRFRGLVVSDYWAVDFLHEHHGVVVGPPEAAVAALRAGVDVELPQPRCYPTLASSVRRGVADEAVIDDAVRRVLTAKFDLGLFDLPGTAPRRPAVRAVDTPGMRSVATRAAEASIALLRNEGGLLPLSATGGGRSVRRLAVIGPNADSAAALCGNYSFVNHVAYRALFGGPPGVTTTIVEALSRRADRAGIDVGYALGCATASDDPEDLTEALSVAASADVAIVVVGDRAGHLGRGTVGEGSDADDLALPGHQQQLLEAVAASGTPMVVVHVAGRAHDLSWAAEHARAIVACWFPGDEGAAAVAGVIFGDVNPAGRCPVTFSRGAGQQPMYYDHRVLSRQDYGPRASGRPVFAFGHGLSYTSFVYSHLVADEAVPTDGTIRVSCAVTNTGARPGAEVVQVYVRDPVASVVRPVRQLRAFQRVELAPAESLVIEFEIPTDLLAFTGPDLERIVEPGEVVIEIGAASDDIRLAVPVTLSGAVQRVGAAARLRHRALVHRVATGTAPTSRRSVGPELGHVDLSDR